MAGTIIRGEEHFFTTIYEGNGAGQRVGKFVPFTDQATLSKSVKIDAGSDEGLYRDFTTPTNNKKWTFSGWFKLANLGTNRTLISSGLDDGDYSDVRFNTNNIIYFQNRVGATNLVLSSTDRSFEDTSIWYHIVLIYDSDQGSASDRWKVYVNGDLQSVNNYPGSGDASTFNKASMRHRLSVSGTTTSSEFTPAFEGDFAGIAQQMFFDGQAYTPDNFGITDTSTGRWIPKTLGSLTYGNNGFRLDFANTAGQTIGDDTSGNGNDFSLYNLTTADLTTDSPTQNHFTIDPGRTGSGNTLSEGNLKIVTSTSNNNSGFNSGKLIGNTGKYYFEAVDTNSTNWGIGINAISNVTSSGTTPDVTQAYLFLKNGTVSINGTQTTSQYSAWSDGATLGIAIDMDNKQIKLYVNNSLTYTISNVVVRGREYFIMGRDYSGSGSQTITLNFGQKSFTHTPPTGFVALQQDNLPTTEKGMSDFVWIKNRDATDSHQLYDSSRGKHKDLQSDATNAESTTTDGLQKFLKGGQQIEDDVSINTSGESYVSWNWVANGGTTSANTDGSGATIASTIQANQTAGFSIVEYTGNGTAGAKVAHGLSQAPEWIITKRLESSGSWHGYHSSQGATKYFVLNSTNTIGTSALTWNNTAPDATTFTLGSGNTNNNGGNLIAYCWHSVKGFSRFGSYTGNYNTDGPFIFLGFKPAYVLFKNIDTARNWCIYDNARDPINPVANRLLADTTNADINSSATPIDFLSNGFKIRGQTNATNESGDTIIYMAFAEHPFNGDGGTAFATAR